MKKSKSSRIPAQSIARKPSRLQLLFVDLVTGMVDGSDVGSVLQSIQSAVSWFVADRLQAGIDSMKAKATTTKFITTKRGHSWNQKQLSDDYSDTSGYDVNFPETFYTVYNLNMFAKPDTFKQMSQHVVDESDLPRNLIDDVQNILESHECRSILDDMLADEVAAANPGSVDDYRELIGDAEHYVYQHIDDNDADSAGYHIKMRVEIKELQSKVTMKKVAPFKIEFRFEFTSTVDGLWPRDRYYDDYM